MTIAAAFTGAAMAVAGDKGFIQPRFRIKYATPMTKKFQKRSLDMAESLKGTVSLITGASSGRNSPLHRHKSTPSRYQRNCGAPNRSSLKK
jgi:hypothetical protein